MASKETTTEEDQQPDEGKGAQIPIVTPTKKQPSESVARGDPKTPERANEKHDEKPSAAVAAAPVSTNTTVTKNSTTKSNAITGDTVLGFQRYPTHSNRQLLMQQPGFAHWARKQQHNTNISPSLAALKQWLGSKEAKKLEKLAERGREKFPFGQHKGLTFYEIVTEDPDYHERHMRALSAKGRSPNEVLSRYIRFCNDWSRAESSSSSSGKKRKASTAANRQRSEASQRSQYRRELSMRRNERFPFGQHRGQPFWMVARDDPSYHLRFKEMGNSPNEVLTGALNGSTSAGPAHMLLPKPSMNSWE